MHEYKDDESPGTAEAHTCSAAARPEHTALVTLLPLARSRPSTMSDPEELRTEAVPTVSRDRTSNPMDLDPPTGATPCKKHPCPDCRACQFCSDTRCLACRGNETSKPPRVSIREQIDLYNKRNEGLF